MADLEQSAKQLFGDALDLPPERRAAFLDRACKNVPGNIAPFETNPPSSTLQVCVTGGNDVKYSIPNANITLVFGGPATTHFGQQPSMASRVQYRTAGDR